MTTLSGSGISALAMDEELLRLALEAAQLGTWEVDLTSGTIKSSIGTDRIFGLPPGKALSDLKTWTDLIHPEDRQQTIGLFQGAAADDAGYSAQYRIIWPDGSLHWINARGTVLGDQFGTRRAIGVVDDITELKTAEEVVTRRTEQLAESEAQYRIMGDAIPFGVWLCDKDGGARYVSPSFLELLDMTWEEMQEFGWTRRLAPEDVEAMMRHWLHCVSTGENWDSEHRIVDKHGRFNTVLTRGRPVRDPDGQITSWVGVNLDITARKHAEAELARKNEELQVLLERIRQLDQSRTRFFANVSHELRTPLALILGPVEAMLADCADLRPELQRDLRIIRRNAGLLLHLVNDLLDLSKIDAGKMAPNYSNVDLAQMVRLIAGQFDALARDKGIACSVEALSACPAQVDLEKLERVLLNLLSNAFKFTPDGGRISCSLAVIDGRRARISVVDSGPGVRPELRDRIFERFTQGDEQVEGRFGGTGLGLSITHDFIALHGGRIEVRDAPEGGAAFVVEIPLAAPAGKAAPDGVTTLHGIAVPHAITASDVSLRIPVPSAAAEMDHTVPEDTITGPSTAPLVLVVEDNADLRQFLNRTLSTDWRVATAADGRDGLAKALELAPDLILSDLMMPGMRGDTMVAEMRTHPDLAFVPVIVLSAQANDNLRLDLLRNAVQDYIVKPFSADELRARVRNQVNAKRAADILRAELSSSQHDLEALARELSAKSRQLQTAFTGMRIARDEAMQATRAKSDLLGLVSHELRTPLTGIELQIAMLEHRRADPLTDRQRQALDALKSANVRLRRLIEMILEYSRIESGRIDVSIEEFDLAILTKEILEEIGWHAVEKRLAVIATDFDAPVLVQTDQGILRLVLINLIDNAIKFTEQGEIRISLERQAEFLEITVADTGPGIPPERRVNIFEPFEQGEHVKHKHSPGVGLGLAIVRRMIGILGGSIRLESVEGAGSTFIVMLPCSPASGGALWDIS